MAVKSTYLSNLVLDSVFGNDSFPPSLGIGANTGGVGNLYIALFINAPSVSGGGTECSGTGYARAAVANTTTNWPAASGGAKSNGTSISFGSASGTWGTVTYVCVFDALTGGNLLYFAPLSQTVLISDGDAVSFPAGSIAFTES